MPEVNFSGFNTLHFNLRTFIVGVVVITPIWLVDIILFSNSFFKDHDLLTSVLIAYCLTLSVIVIHYYNVVFKWLADMFLIKRSKIVLYGTVEAAFFLLIYSGFYFYFANPSIFSRWIPKSNELKSYGFKGFAALYFAFTGFTLIYSVGNNIITRITRINKVMQYKKQRKNKGNTTTLQTHE